MTGVDLCRDTVVDKIIIKELKKVLKKVKSGKVLGHDRIIGEMLNYL